MGMALLITERSDFKTRNSISNKKREIHNDKGSTCQEDLTILNIYIYSKAASKHMKKTNRTKRRNRDFDTLLLKTDRSRLKISKDNEDS